MIIKYKDIDEHSFLTKYLEFYNLMIVEDERLNPSEIALMVEFVLLPPKFEYQRFGSLAKSKVIEAAAERNWILTKLNINNKLYALLDKKFLRRDIDKVIYLPKHFVSALSEFRKNKMFEIKVQFKANGFIENNSDSGENS